METIIILVLLVIVVAAIAFAVTARKRRAGRVLIAQPSNAKRRDVEP
jgi:septation ring formation regulator EzrA